MPGFSNLARYPLAWLNQLVGRADAEIKQWCQQNLEMGYNEGETHDGSQTRTIVADQFPLWTSQTTIAAASNGQALPQGTINVASVKGFHPGFNAPAGSFTADPPGFAVQTGVQTWTYVTYTGTLPNPGNPTASPAFTGCSGGTGSLIAGNRVCTPVVWFDTGGYGGQTPGGFSDGTLMVLGSQYIVQTDKGGRYRSNRGTIERIGGAGQGFIGFWPEVVWQGKLGAMPLPRFSRGDRNVKISYASGYAPYDRERQVLRDACVMLVAQKARIGPKGQNLQSESLGAYSYNLATDFDNPEMSEIRRMLAPFRESAWMRS